MNERCIRCGSMIRKDREPICKCDKPTKSRGRITRTLQGD